MLILASKSPRRREILDMMGYRYVCCPADTDETILPGTPPADAVQLLAERKAAAVPRSAGDVVIGSDTVVALDNEIFGKPADESDAKAMLRRLSGHTHTVYTGVCIIGDNKKTVFCSPSKVTFYPLSDEDIDRYVATGEPLDKAGAYGIQGKGLINIEKIDGDFYAVMGLPAARTARELIGFDIFPEN